MTELRERSDRQLKAAEALYVQGDIETAYGMLVDLLTEAITSDETDTQDEVHALAAGMAQHLHGFERDQFHLLSSVAIGNAQIADLLPALPAPEASKADSQREPNVRLIDVRRDVALMAAASSVLVIVSLLLPLTEGTAFGYVANNRLIQKPDGWLLAVGAFGVFANSLLWDNAYRRSILLLAAMSAVSVLDAIYIGTQAKVCGSQGVGTVCQHASPSYGVYALGLGGITAALALITSKGVGP